MSATLPVTAHNAHDSAFAEAFTADALYDFLTEADAKIMAVIVFTIQFPILSRPSFLKGSPGSNGWMRLVFSAIQFLMPSASLDDKLKLAAQTAIELRPAMTSKDWFEFLCKEAKTLQSIHHSVLTLFANHLLNAGAASKDSNLMTDLMGLDVPKADVIYACGPLPLRLLKCLGQRSDLGVLFSASAFTDQLGRLVMKHKLRGLEKLLSLPDLGNVFGQDLGL